MKVIPNPAKSQLNFQVSGVKEDEMMTFTMLNAQGVTVFTMQLPILNGQYSNTMDVTHFPRGIYYLKAGNSKNQVIQKLILQ